MSWRKAPTDETISPQSSVTPQYERNEAMITQNEAVYQAVLTVFGKDGKLDGPVPETTKWTSEQKQQVHAIVFSSFKHGICAKVSGGQDDATLLKYIPGLVNNHVRKDTRLNGGVEYTPKRPGSRSGSADESVKAMRTLLSLTTDPEAKLAIQAEIDKRMAELKPKVELNVEALPESLRHLVK